MDSTLIAPHFFQAIGAGLIGIGLAGGCGWLLALIIGRVTAHLPWVRGIMMLLPWRTMVINLGLGWLLLLIQRIPFLNLLRAIGLPGLVWLERPASAMTFSLTALLVGLLTAPLLTGFWLDRRQTPPLVAALISRGRTILLLSPAILLLTGSFFNHGLGAFMSLRFGLLDFAAALSAWLTLIGWTLVIDIALGAGQWLAWKSWSQKLIDN